jgi:hypothetical protein
MNDRLSALLISVFCRSHQFLTQLGDLAFAWDNLLIALAFCSYHSSRGQRAGSGLLVASEAFYFYSFEMFGRICVTPDASSHVVGRGECSVCVVCLQVFLKLSCARQDL